MPTLEAMRPGNVEDAAALSADFETMSAHRRLEVAVRDLFPGRIALVSSFGAESAVLLHLASQVDSAIPVVFVDTGQLFAETLAHRDRLVACCGLTNVTTHAPDAADLAQGDPDAFLWARDPDRCCHIRKVLPLARALAGRDAWISGRKRFQAASREHLPIVQAEGGHTKINPIADWSAQDILVYQERCKLPRHDLVAKNYLSIGCIPCTSPVRPGEHSRTGRWRGRAKVECGIHTDFPEAGAGI